MKSNYWKALAVLAAGAGILLSVERVAAAHSEDWDRDGRTLQADVGGYPTFHRTAWTHAAPVLRQEKSHTIISLRV